MKNTAALVLTVSLSAIVCVGGAMESTVHVQKQGPLTLSISAPVRQEPIEMQLSDSLDITISTDDAELEVKAPAALVTSPVWKVRPHEAERTRAGWRQRFVVYPLAPGPQVLQIEPFGYRDRAGTWKTVSWQPVAVKVTTQVTDADVNNLRDITDIEHLPPSPSIWDWAKWVVVGAVVLAVIMLAARRLRRPRATERLSPEAWAQRELDRLVALNLPEAGRVESFHTLLANIVRRYLEARFQVPARRQTTQEFLRGLETAPHLSPSKKELLADFLARCDLAKFARARPSTEDCLATAEMARKLLE